MSTTRVVGDSHVLGKSTKSQWVRLNILKEVKIFQCDVKTVTLENLICLAGNGIILLRDLKRKNLNLIDVKIRILRTTGFNLFKEE